MDRPAGEERGNRCVSRLVGAADYWIWIVRRASEGGRRFVDRSQAHRLWGGGSSRSQRWREHMGCLLSALDDLASCQYVLGYGGHRAPACFSSSSLPADRQIASRSRGIGSAALRYMRSIANLFSLPSKDYTWLRAPCFVPSYGYTTKIRLFAEYSTFYRVINQFFII